MQAQKDQPLRDNNQTLQQADLVDITYYTDPLCCWSWAFEREWQKLQNDLKGRLKYRYCMGGLLPGWKNYNDVVNAVSRPIQMGPVWLHAATVTEVEIKHDIWVKDPPASSYPACFAVKCAEFQSAIAAEKYLRLLRQACMIEGKNIAKKAVLYETAAELAKDKETGFSLEEFQQDMKENKALEALKKDLNEVASLHINRFPTLVIRRTQQPARLITGYRTYAALLDAIEI